MRSWCIVEADGTDGLPPLSGGPIYYLETAALERSTARMYRVFVRRKHIDAVWNHFLHDALVELNASAVEYSMTSCDAPATWQANNKIQTRNLSYSKKKLASLKDDGQLMLDHHPGVKKHYDDTLSALQKK